MLEIKFKQLLKLLFEFVEIIFIEPFGLFEL